MMADELDNLHRTCMQVLDSATNANFTSKEDQLQSINHSLNVLKALHTKKQERERVWY